MTFREDPRLPGIPSQGVVSPAYDMWGLGVILSEMVTLKLMVKDICKTTPLCLNRAVRAPPMTDEFSWLLWSISRISIFVYD